MNGIRRTGDPMPELTDDAGFTLLELLVSMTIMSIFLAMFTTSILQMYRSANKNEASWIAQSQLSIAFERLDKQVRYAVGISAQGTVSGDPYIEYLTTNTGIAVCTELRLHVATAQLQARTWLSGSTPLTPTSWIPLVSGVSATQPFTLLPADATYNFQRMRVTLAATSGSADTKTTKTSDITFTALNTSLLSPSPSVCTEGRAVP